MYTRIFLSFLCGLLMQGLQAQGQWSQYEPNQNHPYGQKNPEAPAQLHDFKPMIGTCDCRSVKRNQDGSWEDTTAMLWTFRYVMNGTGIQDITFREGRYATSIRQYDADSSHWVVSYQSYPVVTSTVPVWTGSKVGDSIVLYRPYTASSGQEGRSRLIFSNISSRGFDWRGEWISNDGSTLYPFWYIWCTRRHK